MSATDRLPREDSAERYCIGCMIAFPDRADEILSRLRPPDLVAPAHRAILDVLARQHTNGGIDPVLAGRELQSHPEFQDGSAHGYLLELAQGVVTSAHCASEAKKIVDARRKRQLFTIGEMLCEGAQNGLAPDDIRRAIAADLYEFDCETEADKPREKFTFADLRREYPRLHPPVVDGLFREGETVNIIAPSKYGKSWLAYYLALCVVVGRDLFGKFATSPGGVLLIDNELHKPTLAHRIDTVADALELPTVEYENDLQVWALRGNIRSLHDLAPEIEAAASGDEAESERPRVLIYDSKYRFQRPGSSENDNSEETQIYNLLDRISDKTGVANILIHHSSKGSQSDKRVTDVGAGAGAQSRAADCHLILREHEEEHVTVLDAALRSFPPIAPLPLRWCFPLWQPADDVDPGKLKGRLTAKEQRQGENDREGICATINALRAGPAGLNQLCRATGFGKERQRRLVNVLCATKNATFSQSTKGGQKCHQYTLVE